MQAKNASTLRRILTILAVTPLAITQAFEISRGTVDGGGGFSSGGSFELEGTVGQPDAGFSTGDGFELSGGFWIEEPPGDCNATGSVNLLDYADMETCLSGPSITPTSDCECFDFDSDGDIDLLDFADFQENFNKS